MPLQPNPPAAHYDELLTHFSIAFMQDDSTYIADRVLTPLYVDKYKGDIRTIAKNTRYRTGMRPRAPRTASPIIGRAVGLMGYQTEPYSVADEVDAREEAMAVGNYMPLQEAQENVTSDYMMFKEKRFAEFIFDESNWTAVPAGAIGTKWDQSGSSPVTDISELCLYLRRVSGGHMPNTIVTTPEVHEVLKFHDEVQEWRAGREASGAKRKASHADLAELFEVANYLELGAVQDTSEDQEPNDSPDFSWIQHDGFWLGYVHPQALTGKANTAGCRVIWTGSDATEGDMDHRISSFYKPETKSTIVELECEFQNLAISPDLAVCKVDVIG